MSKLKVFFKNHYPISVTGEDVQIIKMRDEVREGIRMQSQNINDYPTLASKCESLPSVPSKFQYEHLI